METTSRSGTVICPKCGEDNADNFRFCGMCGAVLEPRVPAGAPRVVTAREGGTPIAVTIPANPPKARTEKQQVGPISGPSLLGLGGQPSLDSLRDKAFSGSDPLFEVEEPRTGGRKILLLLLLAALGAAGWWTYTNYIAIGRPEPAVSNPKATLPPSTNMGSVPAPAAGSSTTAPANNPAPETKPGETPAQGTDNTAAKPDVNPENKTDTAATKAEGAPEPAAKATDQAPAQKSGEAEATGKAAAKADREPSVKPARVAKAAAPVAADNGEAEFRKGEAYLYGRGVRENCDAAIKSLKAASGKMNPRARSAFGTMYATGHCVPRDLPTSYSWFALALRADPNNQILEKDLKAIWNQMTPPERQLATKLRQ